MKSVLNGAKNATSIAKPARNYFATRGVLSEFISRLQKKGLYQTETRASVLHTSSTVYDIEECEQSCLWGLLRWPVRNAACALALMATPVLGEQHLINQKNRTFSQTEISIKRGESIVFKNADDVTHNVFSVSSGMEFDIRRQPPGGSSTVVFNKEGVAEVRCSIHPKMKLIVTVRK
jgi:plastocyanin